MTAIKNSRGTYEVTLSGKTFEFQRWGAEEQTDTLIDLMAVVGDSVGGLPGLYKKSGGDGSGQTTISQLVSSLSRGMSRDKALTKRLLRKLSSEKLLCEGVAVQYNTFYQDDLALSFAVMKANLEVQYGNFLSAVASLVSDETAATEPDTQEK